MTLLTRDEALKPNNHFRIEQVDVTEWGDPDPVTGEREPKFVFVRQISSAERDALENSVIIQKRNKQIFDWKNYRAKIAVLVCCDEAGRPIFKPGDEEYLGNKSIGPMERIHNMHKKLNSFSDEDEEELVKN
ncbi:MAG: hypothetical protein FWC43_12490 [Planctomycetaceae bacterium]|nr:hypothetical protein [Planctomycetaceae bacterium]